MEKVSVSIADIHIEVASQIPIDDLKIREKLQPFLGHPVKPLYHVELSWEALANPLDIRAELIYDPGDIWKMYRSDSSFYATFNYASTNLPLGQADMFETNAEWNRIRMLERPVGPSWSSLLNLGAGEIIMRSAILFIQGLVFHASGIDDHGRGILFVGHSGAGKSTQALLWEKEEGITVLNDDRVIAKLESNGVHCYGTPWGGTANIARNHSVPLHAIIILEQAQENIIRPVPIKDLSSCLMPRLFLPYWDDLLMSLAMKNLEAILFRVPVYHLKCRPEREVIPMVRSIL